MPDCPATQPIPHVLVIDDDPAIAAMLARVLEDAGCRVTHVHGGAEALERLADEEFVPDIVVTDIAMPDVDGLALINAMRGRARPVPIIAMSGGSAIGFDVLGAARKLGAVAVIEKPFRRSQIVELIDRHLGTLRSTPDR